jgi:2'-5' RNA ligase
MPARLFLAVDLPDAACQRVATLRTDLPGARWTDPAQLHLTLRFWAAVPEEEVDGMLVRLAEVRRPAFGVRLHGVGVFPPRRGPARVLWTGVDPEPPLRALKSAVDEAVGPDAEAAGRGFHPHLTLARFREPPGPALARYLDERAGFASEPWTVDAFTLYRSTLGSDGARHQPLRRYPLG